MRAVPPRQPLAAPDARSAAALALAAWLLAAAGCGEEPAPEPEVVRPVKMLTIVNRGTASTREYPGTVKAAQTAEMAFEVPGKITEFLFKEGEQVEAGQVLARLDARDYQAQLDSARAQYENARHNYERAEKLFREGALAAIERDRRKATADSAEAALREAQKAVEDTELVAPFTGILARKLVEDYANVQAKQVVLVLTDDSFLEVKLDVPERDLAGTKGRRSMEEITQRLEPQVVVTSLPDRPFDARLTELASTANPDTRTFEATVAFVPPPGVQVLPGMTAKVIIHVPEEAAGGGLRIPASATFADPQGQACVWVVDPETMTVSRRAVELGQVFGSDVVVRSGLDDGDVVAVSGVAQLREGMTVRRLEL
jgi:RND family efflux transporter MFP subunit